MMPEYEKLKELVEKDADDVNKPSGGNNAGGTRVRKLNADIKEMAQTVRNMFQAEGGTRDPSVTGVQTCALPIYALALGHGQVLARRVGRLGELLAPRGG